MWIKTRQKQLMHHKLAVTECKPEALQSCHVHMHKMVEANHKTKHVRQWQGHCAGQDVHKAACKSLCHHPTLVCFHTKMCRDLAVARPGSSLLQAAREHCIDRRISKSDFASSCSRACFCSALVSALDNGTYRATCSTMPDQSSTSAVC